jgi:hypothetical protein
LPTVVAGLVDVYGIDMNRLPDATYPGVHHITSTETSFPLEDDMLALAPFWMTMDAFVPLSATENPTTHAVPHAGLARRVMLTNPDGVYTTAFLTFTEVGIAPLKLNRISADAIPKSSRIDASMRVF